MKLLPYYVLSVISAFALCACDPEHKPAQRNDTSNAPLSVPGEQRGFNPGNVVDKRFVVAKEIVSDFGPNNIVRDVLQDRNGFIWLASWEGIVKYGNGKFTNMTLQSGLYRYAAYSLFEDSKGNLWFGTTGAGVYRYDGLSFTNYNTNHGLAGNLVWSIFEDKAGNIWLGTESGASCYNGHGFVNLTDSSELIGEVFAIAEDTNGVMWLGGSEGLFLYDGDSVSMYMSEYDTPWMNVRDIKCDHNGTIWIGCPSGLYEYIPTANGEPHMERRTKEFVGYIHEDPHGNLLITSGSIFRYNRVMNDTIADGKTIALFGAIEDNLGNIWYGAFDGVHKNDGVNDDTFIK